MEAKGTGAAGILLPAAAVYPLAYAPSLSVSSRSGSNALSAIHATVFRPVVRWRGNAPLGGPGWYDRYFDWWIMKAFEAAVMH